MTKKNSNDKRRNKVPVVFLQYKCFQKGSVILKLNVDRAILEGLHFYLINKK